MPRRFTKQKKSYLGSKNCGTGNAKNRRGKGGKGGWGRAGMHKHRWTYITSYEPDFFGVHGFASLRKGRAKVMNLFEINQMALKGRLETKEGRLFIDFDGKILGTGEMNQPVVVKALAFSKKAKDKITAAGGQAVSPAAQ